MTANPTTDQILANLARVRRDAELVVPMPAKARDDMAEFAERLTDTLPGIDPAVIGQVLLHAADVYGMFATCGNRLSMSRDTVIAVLTLGDVGRRLYLGDERTTSNNAQI